MDALLELLFEIIFEVFGELIVLLIGKMFDFVSSDKRALKITKIVVYSILSVLLLLLLTVSILYKKNVLSIMAIAYLIFLLLTYYVIFICKENDYKILQRIIRIIVIIFRYAFTISLIVVGGIYLIDPTAKTLLIIGSSIAILIYFFIDCYRIYRHKKKIKFTDSF